MCVCVKRKVCKLEMHPSSFCLAYPCSSQGKPIKTACLSLNYIPKPISSMTNLSAARSSSCLHISAMLRSFFDADGEAAFLAETGLVEEGDSSGVGGLVAEQAHLLDHRLQRP